MKTPKRATGRGRLSASPAPSQQLLADVEHFLGRVGAIGASAAAALAAVQKVSSKDVRKAARSLRRSVSELSKAAGDIGKAGRKAARKHPIETAVAVGLAAALVGLEAARRRGMLGAAAGPQITPDEPLSVCGPASEQAAIHH
jgi:hypothetical protein